MFPLFRLSAAWILARGRYARGALHEGRPRESLETGQPEHVNFGERESAKGKRSGRGILRKEEMIGLIVSRFE